MTEKSKFNSKLTDWLNARDYVSGDWPNNLSKEIQREADKELGEGYMLDEYGWPTRSEKTRLCND